MRVLYFCLTLPRIVCLVPHILYGSSMENRMLFLFALLCLCLSCLYFLVGLCLHSCCSVYFLEYPRRMTCIANISDDSMVD
mmetsp:Transcript_21307/g.43000  ORF Transcript_21307/g.43000 Transcript_21307/m.43000 type:complete len:81 (-) Transcript_21307:242-484(-)